MASAKTLGLRAHAVALEVLDEIGLALARVGDWLSVRGGKISDHANTEWAGVVEQLQREGSEGP